jgi:hypothetical protein
VVVLATGELIDSSRVVVDARHRVAGAALHILGAMPGSAESMPNRRQRSNGRNSRVESSNLSRLRFFLRKNPSRILKVLGIRFL